MISLVIISKIGKDSYFFLIARHVIHIPLWFAKQLSGGLE